MATATKKPESDSERSKRIIDDRRALENTAEQILIESEEGTRFDGDELAVFAELQWDAKRIERERSRAKAVHEARRTFGSFAHITTAEHNADEAEQTAKVEGERIRAEIERLEAQLRVVDNDAKAKRREVESRRAAMHQLRGGLLPEAIRERHGKRRSDVKHSFHHVRTAENRIRAIDAHLALNPQNVDDCKAIDLVTGGKLRADKQFPNASLTPAIDEAKWQAYCAELRQERADCEAEIAESKPAFDEAMAEVDALLCHYTGEVPEGFDATAPSPPQRRTSRVAW